MSDGVEIRKHFFLAYLPLIFLVLKIKYINIYLLSSYCDIVLDLTLDTLPHLRFCHYLVRLKP